NLAIMGNVYIGHDPVVVAYPGYADVLRRAGVDGDVFADHIAVADFQPGRLTLVFFILRHTPDGAKPIEDIIFAYGGIAIQDAMWPYLRARPNAHARSHNTVCAYRNVVGQFGLGRHNGGGMDALRHQSSSARMAHM